MKRTDLSDASCAIAQALDVVGDWWTLLVVRDVAGGLHRFDSLQRETGISRKVLTERLGLLVTHGVLERRPYSEHPPRHEYHLTAKGRGLLPVLIALQDWGTRHVLGDGSLTATSAATSPEARRVQDLVGRRLEVAALPASGGSPTDPVGGTPWTVVYCFPGAEAPGGRYPPGWGDIPGAPGCTLESTTYRDRHADFASAGATVHGVSTQRPDQLAAFSQHAGLPFALLSDTDLTLATALRLPTFRAAGVDRLKRLTLVVDRAREVRAVLFPVTDPAGSVDDALAVVGSLRPA
jgi:DNA-binding HxlR family transcriptional regulator/peroxiredoxin